MLPDEYLKQYLGKDGSSTIFDYITWGDLKEWDENGSPCFLWERIYDKFCQDTVLKQELDFYIDDRKDYRSAILNLMCYMGTYIRTQGEQDRIPNSILMSRDFINLYCSNHTYRYEYEQLPNEWLSSKEIILIIIKNNRVIFHLLASKFRSDPEIAFEAIKKNRAMFQFADQSLRRDKVFISQAIKFTGLSILQHIDPALKQDKDYMQTLHNTSNCNAHLYIDHLLNLINKMCYQHHTIDTT